MSKYTTTIKNLIDNNFDLGLKSYPIFDENYRDVLNNKIIKHYYFNEIGQETPALFKFMINQKMDEIMPYYNILYELQKELLENPLKNVDLKETFTRDTSSNATSTSSSENNGKNLFQDTPQGKIWQTDIDNQNYATNVTMNKNNISDNSSTSGTGLENYVKNIIGNNGNMYTFQIISNIKKEFINIDMLIIDELVDLFMGLL